MSIQFTLCTVSGSKVWTRGTANLRTREEQRLDHYLNQGSNSDLCYVVASYLVVSCSHQVATGQGTSGQSPDSRATAPLGLLPVSFRAGSRDGAVGESTQGGNTFFEHRTLQVQRGNPPLPKLRYSYTSPPQKKHPPPNIAQNNRFLTERGDAFKFLFLSGSKC